MFQTDHLGQCPGERVLGQQVRFALLVFAPFKEEIDHEFTVFQPNLVFLFTR